MNEAEVAEQVSTEIEHEAIQRASDRASAARWDLNTAIFLFAVLILVIILATIVKAGLEIVAPIAIFGLALVWLMGWRRGKQLYQRFYDEEIAKLEQESKKAIKAEIRETIEETIEAKVQKALRERFR